MLIEIEIRWAEFFKIPLDLFERQPGAQTEE